MNHETMDLRAKFKNLCADNLDEPGAIAGHLSTPTEIEDLLLVTWIKKREAAHSST